MLELEPIPAALQAESPAQPVDSTSAALPALVGRLAARVEELLALLRDKPAQEESLLVQLQALRAEQAAIAANLTELQRGLSELNHQGEVAQRPEVALAALQQRVDELAQHDTLLKRMEATIAELQCRVDELSRREHTEAAIATRLLVRPATAPADPELSTAPVTVTIGSVPSKREADQLRDAIAHLPSVAHLESSGWSDNRIRFTVRLHEAWPRASFTRQLSWLEGLRLSLVFNGPDGLSTDLLSVAVPARKRRFPWPWRRFHRSASSPALQPTGSER